MLSNARVLSLPSLSLCGLRVINKMSEKVLERGKRKRTKLKCLVHGYNQTFDDDYRTSHNIKGPLQPKIFISEHDVIRPPENESVIIFFISLTVL